VLRAQCALVWERAWPSLAGALLVVALFLGVSWFGVWDIVPPVVRIMGVVLFTLLFVATLLPLAQVRWPSRTRALTRIDQKSGGQHRPASSLDDQLAQSGDDPLTHQLWKVHQARIRAVAQDLHAGIPRSDVPVRDPFALRAIIILGAGVAFFAAGADRLPRISQAFDWSGWRVAAVPARVDAWVAPPAYTRKPPVFLTREGAAADPVTVPAGSIVVVRTSAGELNPTASGDIENTPEETPKPLEKRWVLKGNARLRIDPSQGEAREWVFNVTPDTPPAIAFTAPPQGTVRNILQLSYILNDDYGVASAEAVIEPAEERIASPLARPLYGPPEAKLLLPSGHNRSGKAQTQIDLTAHPWAGAHVRIQAKAVDDRGQTGLSKAVETMLPQRHFNDPVAKALVELRRLLSIDVGNRERVATGLDALSLYPDDFNIAPSVYLGLRSGFWQLANARSDENLREVTAYMWEMALRIEDGDMPNAERDLRAAQQALKEALERGASDEEIKKLTQELRQALNKFLSEMARQAARNGQSNQPLPPNAKILTPQDLMNMLDRLENLARGGSRESAQDMLAQLQNMLDNLAQGNSRSQQGQSGQSEAMRQLEQSIQDLGRTIQEQSELRDRTFQQHQSQIDPSQPEQPQGNSDTLQNMEQQQGALKKQLGELMNKLGQLGLGGNSKFDDAAKAMGQAQGELGKNDAGSAAQSQGQALARLREGAKSLMDQLGQGSGTGQAQGQQGLPGQVAPGQARGGDVDPLGRPIRSRRYDAGDSVRVPGEIQAQRARKILEELRRRLSDPSRPQGELDYLERLIEP
jgi:uncharacterized protein (TIGR02302 family)